MFLELGWYLEEHVTLAQFAKKQDKIVTLHGEGLKNLLQTMEMASGFHATSSGLQSDGVRIMATASERSQLKETLEDSVSQDKDDYSTCVRITLIASCSSKSSSTKGDVLEGGGVSSNVTLSDSSIYMVCLFRMM
ncbi:hypothetical protein Tco_1318125 [Tanacetum coccineum]